MGDVLIRYKVMPEGTDVDLQAISDRFATYVPEHGRVSQSEIVPAFFGLKMLMWAVVLDDKKGGGEELEEKLNSTEGVQSVEVVEMGLL
ncbi:MAG: elongation factor 1-beta [Candidatus Thermoplasmatota archaeon]|nr:elongation factor 1-beta [Candidatus Thermoplasmatota archaeon]